MTASHKRICGPCNACCVELEIAAPELRKKARVPCQNLAGAGCGIYAARPDVCQQFLCGWRLFDELDEGWRPDLSGVLVMRKAPAELPAAWQGAPYGVHLAILGGEAAMMRPAFASYATRLMAQDIPVFLSAASPYILLNDHVEADAEPVFLKQRLAELYRLLHAARFGRSLLKRIVFLYRLQIDRSARNSQRNQRDKTA
jgi:hypothetical protein